MIGTSLPHAQAYAGRLAPDNVSTRLVQVFIRGYVRWRDLDLLSCKSYDLRFNNNSHKVSLTRGEDVAPTMGVSTERSNSNQ